MDNMVGFIYRLVRFVSENPECFMVRNGDKDVENEKQ